MSTAYKLPDIILIDSMTPTGVSYSKNKFASEKETVCPNLPPEVWNFAFYIVLCALLVILYP